MYLIFFDESGKLDRNFNINSYYGALGCTRADYDDITNFVKSFGYKTELHFTAFNLKQVQRYLDAVNYALDKNVNLNIYVVDRIKAEGIGDRLDLTMERMRELFYIKIPERLIYGILRYIEDYKTIRIIYDECDEYETYDLKGKLVHQLNAQAVYRNLNCQITEVKAEDSEKEIFLQIIDVLIGIVTLLIEKKYYLLKDVLETKAEYDYLLSLKCYTEEELGFLSSYYREKKGKFLINCKGDKSKFDALQDLLVKGNQFSKGAVMKAEFLYLLMDSPVKIDRMKKLCLYHWNGENRVDGINIGDYIAEFFHFKTRYDEANKLILLRYHKENPAVLIDIKMVRQLLGFGSSLDNLSARYIRELDF